MILVLIGCAALWWLGGVLRAPLWQKLAVLAAVWAAAFVWFRVPFDLTRDDARVWILATLIGVVVFGYRLILRTLKKRVKMPDTAPPPLFQPAELDRYARHILLREIGGPGQKALKQARVLVIGAGGLGSPALLYLAAAGVGGDWGGR